MQIDASTAIRALLDEVRRLDELLNGWQMTATNAEAELARLRTPAGEVGEVVKRTLAHAEIALGPTRDRLYATADLITRQAAEIVLADARAEYRVDCMRRERDAAEASLREAVEVMRDLRSYAASVAFDEATASDEERELMSRARIVIAKLETKTND